MNVIYKITIVTVQILKQKAISAELVTFGLNGV